MKYKLNNVISISVLLSKFMTFFLPTDRLATQTRTNNQTEGIIEKHEWGD